jgi:predicted PurR-regulated permease PerM
MQQEKRVISISTGTMIRVVLVVLGVGFLYIIRDVVGMLLVSVLLAAVLDPIADFFGKKKIPRSLTVLVIYILLFLVLGVLILAIIPPMIEQTRQIVGNFGSIWDRVVSSFASLQSLSAHYGLEASFKQSITSFTESFSGAFTNLYSTVSSVVNGIISFFVILVITFFLVVEKSSIRSIFTSVVPVQKREYLSSIFSKMQQKVGQWLIGQIVLMLFVGVLSYIGLLAFGVDYALLLAVIAGVTEIIPYVGPVVGGIPAVVFAFAVSPTTGIMVFALYFLIQRVENAVLVPKIMQKATGLNPIFAILALAIGFTVGGIAGGLLAIPVATAANVILSDHMERQNKLNA